MCVPLTEDGDKSKYIATYAEALGIGSDETLTGKL
jgi:hypothetical protein